MKYALIIGNNRYTDQKLAQLKTPAADSQALARVLKDQSIGSFDEVLPLVNKTEFQVSRAISTFLANKKPEDLVLVYFSGHGILDDRGRLFLALKDTQTNLLNSTAISASFIADEMDSCRSKRQILILDCCHSGAFGRGVKGGEQKAVTETTFEGSGFGRVVLTASDSTQFALEGDQVIKQTELSLFTHVLLEGLQTGKADINNDGYISLDEWYDFTYAQVLSTTPKQVPHKWSYRQQGDLIIAKNPSWKKKAPELPAELARLLESPYSSVREAAVKELGVLLHNSELGELARLTLEKLKEDDSRTVSLAAIKQLSEVEKSVEERGTAEKIVPRQVERVIAQKTKHEKEQRDVRQNLENETRAKTEPQTSQFAQIAQSSLVALRTMPVFRIAAFAVVFLLFVAFSFWSIPKLFSTVNLTPTSTLTLTSTRTPKPSQTSTITRTAITTLTPTITPIPASLPSGTLVDYRVQPGDTLEGIAARFNSRTANIGELNGVSAHDLVAGQILQIPVNLISPTPTLWPTNTPIIPTSTPTLPHTSTPAGSRPSTYTMRPGEFANCIARRFDVDPDELIRLNELPSGDVFDPGRILQIPQTGNFPGPRALRNHPTTYTVASSSETINTIACFFGDVDPSDITLANGLSLDVILIAGQQLAIP